MSKVVARCIEASLERKNDFCARYGGEEFVVLLPGTDKEGACKVANDILANINSAAMKHEYSDVSNIVTISIGYTTIDEKSARDANHLVSIADEALYAAKKDGKNKAVFKLA
ncbi:MAG: GGDEF domain-containing protein [Campylobacterales bacterium]|nr:GGDEF domain-containing protein [Campylobacterales bacterium]